MVIPEVIKLVACLGQLVGQVSRLGHAAGRVTDAVGVLEAWSYTSRGYLSVVRIQRFPRVSLKILWSGGSLRKKMVTCNVNQ